MNCKAGKCDCSLIGSVGNVKVRKLYKLAIVPVA